MYDPVLSMCMTSMTVPIGRVLMSCPVADQIWIEFWMIDDRLESLDSFFEVVNISLVVVGSEYETIMDGQQK